MTRPSTTIADLKQLMTGAGKLNVLAAINFLRLNGIFVEVGTLRGDFADQICRFTQSEKLYCVDPYRSYEEFKDAINQLDLETVFQTAKKRLEPFGERVSFLREFSEQAAQIFADGALDMVYIDANHQYEFVKRDLV